MFCCDHLQWQYVKLLQRDGIVQLPIGHGIEYICNWPYLPRSCLTWNYPNFLKYRRISQDRLTVGAPSYSLRFSAKLFTWSQQRQVSVLKKVQLSLDRVASGVYMQHKAEDSEHNWHSCAPILNFYRMLAFKMYRLMSVAPFKASTNLKLNFPRYLRCRMELSDVTAKFYRLF